MSDVTVDITPTWGEIGGIVRMLAMSGERKALEKIWPEAARAFAAAQALNQVMPLLNDQQLTVVHTSMDLELGKQGFGPMKDQV